MKPRLFSIVSALILAWGSCACAEITSPIENPSFEDGVFSTWVSYKYEAGPPLSYGTGAYPSIGVPGSTFNSLPPYPEADGMYVCGMESAPGASKNGGVYQTFTWTQGGGNLTVKVRAYSDKQPNGNGCFVRVGVARGVTSSRSMVAGWASASNTSGWTTLTVPVAGDVATHTVFIESYQPGGTTDKMSTLWDDVRWVPYLAITTPPTNTAGDPAHPDTTARISWCTNLPSDTRVEYQSGNGPVQTVYDDTLTTDHTILITNLLPSSPCTFKAYSAAPGCIDVQSDMYSFKTPITISQVSATDGNPDAVVTWKTDAPTDSYVEYGFDTTYGQIAGSPDMVTDHSVTLQGLADGKRYHYRVRSGGGNYTDVYSGDGTFRTLPAPQAAFSNASFERQQSGTPDLYPWDMYSYEQGEMQIDGVVGPYPAAGAGSWFPAEVGIKAYDGSYFLGAGARYIYKNGGVYQRIRLTRSQTCALTARFATYQSAEGGSKDTRVDMGIDPTGGIDPNASTVRWWRGVSPTNDDKWHPGGVVVDAPAGVVTVFLGTRQLFGLEARVVAIDNATFGEPQEMKIGELRKLPSCPGVILKNLIVTYVDPMDTIHEEKTYRKIYVQEAGTPAGIGILLGPLDQVNPADLPLVGNKIELTGAIMSLNMETVVMGYKWTIDHGNYTLPKVLAMKQRDLGGGAINQAALGQKGTCNVGIRVRVFGKITWPDIGVDGDVYIDDGSLLPTAITEGGVKVTGVRVRLRENGNVFYKGDYIALNGVLTMENTGSVSWPRYEYVVALAETDDWTLLQTSGGYWGSRAE